MVNKVISRSNLIHNLNFCKNFNKKIMVMVKANAYGHGVKHIVKQLGKNVDFYGVANNQEALNLRKLTRAKILIVGKTINYNNVIKNDISITIDTLNELEIIEKTAKKINKVAYVHIAVNTGMNRIGVKNINQFNNMLKFIFKSKNIILEGIFTHMFDADYVKNHFKQQIKKFEHYVKLIKNQNILIHIGGSFCLNNQIPNFINMIRVGYFVYGYGNVNLKPIMHIVSNVIKIVDCKNGEHIGYGNCKIKKDSKIAIIPAGYADGIPRQLSNKSYILVNNHKCKIVGCVCMDMFMVNVTGLNVCVGDSVIIFNDAEYFAKRTNTSPYEILTNFSKARGKVLIK